MGPHELGTSGILYRVPVPPTGRYTYYPGTSEIPEQLAASTHNVSLEQRISTPAPRSGRHIVGVEFTKDRVGDHYEPIGTARLYVDDNVMAEQEIRTVAAFYALCGEGLCVGYDGGDAVSSAYTPKFPWTGGQIHKVVYDVADDAYVDVERHLAAAMARD
jgi:hypothetical protein